MNKLIYIFPFLMISCTSQPVDNTEKKEQIVVETKTEDTLSVSKEIEDKKEETSAETYVETAKGVGENVMEGDKVKEVKMEQVTFCDCVKKQNDIDNRMEEAEEDAAIEALMKEMDELSKGECKALLSETQTTPEQREERKKRIKACLAKS